MKKSDSRKFVIIEGSTVVGSFATLKDALEFRTKGASRSSRIVTDRGKREAVQKPGGATHGVWLKQFIDDR